MLAKVAELALRRVGRKVELLARDGHRPLVVGLGRVHLGGVVAEGDILAFEFALRSPLVLSLLEADAGVDGAVGFDDACERRVGLFMFRELLLRGGLKRLDEVTLLHDGSGRGSHYSPFPSSFSASVRKLSCVEVLRIRSKVSPNVTNDLVGALVMLRRQYL